MKEYLKEYCDNTNKENKRMHDILVNLVNKQGGEIDVSDEGKDNIYAIVFDGFEGKYKEYLVTKIRVVNNNLELYVPEYYYDWERDDIPKDDFWFSLMGGLVMQNATLYYICECLEEYINN